MKDLGGRRNVKGMRVKWVERCDNVRGLLRGHALLKGMSSDMSVIACSTGKLLNDMVCHESA